LWPMKFGRRPSRPCFQIDEWQSTRARSRTRHRSDRWMRGEARGPAVSPLAPHRPAHQSSTGVGGGGTQRALTTESRWLPIQTAHVTRSCGVEAPNTQTEGASRWSEIRCNPVQNIIRRHALGRYNSRRCSVMRRAATDEHSGKRQQPGGAAPFLSLVGGGVARREMHAVDSENPTHKQNLDLVSTKITP
jgi:hypothetical protein